MGIIYKYTSPSGKSYIGQTFYNRSAREGKDGSKYKGCTAFYNAIEKYGIENFEYDILEECDNSELDNRENYYIHYFNTLVPNGYNIREGGNNTRSWSKKVYQYKQDGTLVKVYDSLTEASQQNNCNISSLSEVCTGRKQTCLGYVWSYENIFPGIKKKHYRNKNVYCFDESGKLIREFETCKNAAAFYNVPLAQIQACANKNRRKRINDTLIFTYEPFVDWDYYTLKHKRSSTTISKESTPKQVEVQCSERSDEDIV